MAHNACLAVIIFLVLIVSGACNISSSINPVAGRGSQTARVADVPNGSSRYTLEFISKNEGWLANGGMLWRTLDGGITWRLTHLSERGKGEITQLNFLDSSKGWLLTFDGLFKTEDAGTTWQSLDSPLDFPKGELRQVRLRTMERGWAAGGLYRRASRRELSLGYPSNMISPKYNGLLHGAVFHTTNGGRTWQLQLLSGRPGRFIQLNVLDENHLIVLGDSGIFYSENGGIQWNEARVLAGCLDQETSKSDDGYPTAAAFVEDRLGWMSFSNGRLVKSTDGGRSWCDLVSRDSWRKEFGLRGFCLRLHFPTAKDGYGLLDDGSLVTTSNSGITWERQSVDMGFDDIYFLDQDYGWAAGLKGLFRLAPSTGRL